MVELPWTLQPWTLNLALKPGQKLHKHSRGRTNQGHLWPPLRPHKETHLTTHTDQREAEAACLGTATLPGHSHPSQARLIKPLPRQCWQEGDFSRSRTSTGIASILVSTEPAWAPTAGHNLGKDYLSRASNTLQQQKETILCLSGKGHTQELPPLLRHHATGGSSWCHCSEVSTDSGSSRHFNLSVLAALQPPSKHSKTQPKPCCDGGTGSAGRENPVESDIERQITQSPIIALHGDLPHQQKPVPGVPDLSSRCATPQVLAGEH